MNTPNLTLEGEHLPLLLSLLKEDQVFPIKPQGSSMFPFFVGNRDTLYIRKPVFPLKRGDIALYRRRNGTYVVHRIHHVTEGCCDSKIFRRRKSSGENHLVQYYMLGDHQVWIEGPIEEYQIYGYVVSYDRKGTYIDCAANKKYRILWNIWLVIRPFRPMICTVWEWIHALRKS